MPLRWTTESPGAHLAIDDVDLDLAEPDRRDDRQVGAGRPAADDDGPGEQLLGREGHRQDVVDAEVERPELRLEVAASGEAEDRRRAPLQGVRGAEPLEQRGAVVVVHVDHGHVRAPLGEDRLRLGQVARRANDEQAVVQRQLDEVDDQRAIVEHERPACLVPAKFHVIDHAGSLLDAPCHAASPGVLDSTAVVTSAAGVDLHGRRPEWRRPGSGRARASRPGQEQGSQFIGRGGPGEQVSLAAVAAAGLRRPAS